MSPQSPPKEPSKPSKGKAKGARRVSNLSEEQRNKKRENDRIAQQNIRRRNKELIEKLQHEVEVLRKLDRVETVRRLLRRNKELEDEIHTLKKTLFIHNGRPYPAPGFEVDTLPSSAPGQPGAADYSSVPQTSTFGSPYLPANTSSPYDQWPSSVVPVPTTVSVNSVESSPGASGPGEDFTPAYVHTTSVPLMEGPVLTTTSTAGNTSAPSNLDTSPPTTAASKADYGELDPSAAAAGMTTEGSLRGGGVKDNNRGWSSLLTTGRCISVPPGSGGYPGHAGVAQSSPYLQESSGWPVYSTGGYYAQTTSL
ncbi:hypothetical protein VTI74DRAFT_9782 [Chaetomium olivicolor]